MLFALSVLDFRCKGTKFPRQTSRFVPFFRLLTLLPRPRYAVTVAAVKSSADSSDSSSSPSHPRAPSSFHLVSPSHPRAPSSFHHPIRLIRVLRLRFILSLRPNGYPRPLLANAKPPSHLSMSRRIFFYVCGGNVRYLSLSIQFSI